MGELHSFVLQAHAIHVPNSGQYETRNTVRRWKRSTRPADGDLEGWLLEGIASSEPWIATHWRKPEDFPPYNFRTETFLRDFGLLHKGMSAASPICYERWRLWATRLAQQLKLPTPGHLDRLVERYYEDKYI